MKRIDSDRNIIFYYPHGTGGKFLINSLGLSDYATLQHSELIQRQLGGEFSNIDKLVYLLSTLHQHKIKDVWEDLGLGCAQTYRVDPLNNVKIPDAFYPILMTARHINLLLFIVGHTVDCINAIRKVWPSAKVISFTNYHTFLTRRKFYSPATAINFSLLPSDYVWESDWYLDKEVTLLKISHLYDQLELSDFNKSYISMYYDAWIDTVLK
jgi:hypothetical protein